MAFSDFKTIEQVMAHYPLLVEQQRFLPDVVHELPDWLLQNLTFSLENRGALESELFFRENFIFPFFHYVWQHHADLKLWTNYSIRYNDELTGAPDYLVAARPKIAARSLLSLPLMAVVEAKRQDFEEGWGQCAAEMIACQKLNGNDLTVYGIVSTGLIWEFGQLTANVLIKHPDPYSIQQPARILGLLNFLFEECERQIHLWQKS